MARTGMSTAEVRRNVRIAQFAGLGLGVLAAALWAMDVPGLGSTLPAKPVVQDESGHVATPVATAAPVVDREAISGIAERLDVAANRPPVATTGGEPVPPPPPPSVPAGRQWKYLGLIGEATRMRALVSLEGRQKIVGEGSTLSLTTPAAEGRPETVDYKATVQSIQPDHIMIQEDGGGKRRVDLEARSAKVAWVSNMPKTVAGAAVNPNSGLTPEARQRLIAQGIDPAQAERMRQAAAAAAAAGRARATPMDPNMNAAMLAAGSKGMNLSGVSSMGAKGAGPATKSAPADSDAANENADDGVVKKKSTGAETAN